MRESVYAWSVPTASFVWVSFTQLPPSSPSSWYPYTLRCSRPLLQVFGFFQQKLDTIRFTAVPPIRVLSTGCWSSNKTGYLSQDFNQHSWPNAHHPGQSPSSHRLPCKTSEMHLLTLAWYHPALKWWQSSPLSKSQAQIQMTPTIVQSPTSLSSAKSWKEQWLPSFKITCPTMSSSNPSNLVSENTIVLGPSSSKSLMSQVNSSHIYLYSAFHNTDCIKAASQW